MVSRYRQPALNISRSRADRLLLPLFVLLITVALPPAQAAEGARPTLQPYTAEYQTTARGFDLSITRKLEADRSGQFVLTNGGKILVVGFHEISVFRVEGGNILPISYVYQGTGLVNRRRELHFRTDPGTISSLYKDKWYDLPYTAATLDRMNQVEQLRLALLRNPDAAGDITLRVADGKRVKDSHLVLVAEELLPTPMGPVDTLHYRRLHDSADRKSDIWLAPRWDYLMVKTVHMEGGDPVEMLLTSAVLGGEEIGLN